MAPASSSSNSKPTAPGATQTQRRAERMTSFDLEDAFSWEEIPGLEPVFDLPGLEPSPGIPGLELVEIPGLDSYYEHLERGA